MLRVALDGEVMARQGSMIAFQGQVDFEYQGSGGIGRMLKKAVTGEGVPLMRCRGKGDVFFANYAAEIHLLRLEGDALSVNGHSILAFESTLSWDIRRIEGASMFAGGCSTPSSTAPAGRPSAPTAPRWCCRPTPPPTSTPRPRSPGAPTSRPASTAP